MTFVAASATVTPDSVPVPSTVPAVRITGTVPGAELFCTSFAPPVIVTPVDPLTVPTPLNGAQCACGDEVCRFYRCTRAVMANVPAAPALIRPNPDDVWPIPPTLSVLAPTVTVRVAPIVTVPVPMIRLLVPANETSVFQFCGLFAVIVMAVALLQLIEPGED